VVAVSPEANALAGRVAEVALVGEMHRYVVETDCGATLIAKETHRGDVPIRVPGEAVTVRWAIEDTLLV
jgi:hypothetical protein